MKSLILSMIIFVLSLLLQGCGSSQPNCCVFIKENTRLSGNYSTDRALDISYDMIRIEDMNGLDKMPDIVIELPSGKMPLSKVSPDLLFAQNSGCNKYGFGPDYKYFEPRLVNSFTIRINADKEHYIFFVVTQQKILSISLYHGAVLWDLNQVKQYTLPITYKQAIELFGEPDKAYTFHQVRL